MSLIVADMGLVYSVWREGRQAYRYREHDGRKWREVAHMNHRRHFRHVTFPCRHVRQSAHAHEKETEHNGIVAVIHYNAANVAGHPKIIANTCTCDCTHMQARIQMHAQVRTFPAPNVEQATKNGIIHDMTPRTRLPHVCKVKT